MLGKTILLVDDDPEIVKTVRHYLQQEGYAVLVAYNGLDALVIVRDQRNVSSIVRQLTVGK